MTPAIHDMIMTTPRRVCDMMRSLRIMVTTPHRNNNIHNPDNTAHAQAMVLCEDISCGAEARHVRVAIDRPADLLRYLLQEPRTSPLLPRVLPPAFIYEARSYHHVTLAARRYLDGLYKAKPGRPAAMWSGCKHTEIAPEHLDALTTSKKAAHIQEGTGRDQGVLHVQNAYLNTPIMECSPDCTCTLRRCVLLTTLCTGHVRLHSCTAPA
jgi:hypothetical protein